MILCKRCNGEGRYLGLGFIMTECTLCKDHESKKQPPSLDKINRNSKFYQKAIKDIMAVNPEISRREAVKMFDEAYMKG